MKVNNKDTVDVALVSLLLNLLLIYPNGSKFWVKQIYEGFHIRDVNWVTSLNIEICVVGTSNQIFTRDSYTEKKFFKNKELRFFFF